MKKGRRWSLWGVTFKCMPEFREGRFCIPLCKDSSVWPSLPVSGIMPHQFAWKSLVLVITERGALLFFAPSPPPLLHWDQVNWGLWISFFQKFYGLVLWGWEPATLSLLCGCCSGGGRMLLAGLIFASVSGEGHCRESAWLEAVGPQTGERQWIPTLCCVSVAGTKLFRLFLSQICSFRSALHTLPASVAGVLRRVPRNIFIVPERVTHRQLPQSLISVCKDETRQSPPSVCVCFQLFLSLTLSPLILVLN